MIQVEFLCGGFAQEVAFKDGSTEEDVQEAFDVWLTNRSDLGWTVVTGSLKDSE